MNDSRRTAAGSTTRVMRLCHIVPSLEEQHGGPSKSVRALCGALARAGHEVELLTTAPDAPKTGHETHEGNLRIRTFHRDTPRALCLSSGLATALRDLSADVVHHHALWLRTLHYATQAARRQRSPLVISPRGMMSEWAWRHHGWRKQLVRHIVHPGALESAAGWHATSDPEAAEVRALGFEQPICVSANGVAAPHDGDIGRAAKHWHTVCPETASRRTAVFYGRFHQKKRVLELIDTWIENAPSDWLLLLVGLPEQYTPAMLEQYVQRQSAAGRVRAFSGAGQPSPYAVASLFLLPSHNENFGMTVAEAMAHGVPVLVTDTTPWRGVTVDNRGWCVPWPRFGATLRTALAESPDALQSRGARARTWVLAEYSWDRAARRLVEFYRGLLKPGP